MVFVKYELCATACKFIGLDRICAGTKVSRFCSPEGAQLEGTALFLL